MSRDIVAGAAVAIVSGRTGILSSVVTAVDFRGAGRYGSSTVAWKLPNGGRVARVSAFAAALTSQGRSKNQSKIQYELPHFLPATGWRRSRL
jgi:hypothetical protein